LKKIIQRAKEKAGYISIETIIVAGLFLALGVWAFNKFYASGGVIIDQAMEIASIPENVTVPKD